MQSRFSAEQLADADTAVSEAVIRKCVHCGFCLATCPTYVLTGDERDSPRGRIYMIKDMLESGRPPSAEVVTHIDRCLSCLACETTCPSGVSYRRLIDHGRAYVEAHHERPAADRWLRRMLAWILPHRDRFSLALRLGRAAAPLTPRSWLPGQVAALLDLAAKTGSARIPPIETPAPASPPKGRVAMLRGCAEPVLSPQIQAAAERLLAASGYEVVRATGEGCCGALTHHLGRETEALDFARRNVDSWCAELDRGLAAIIVTASGCTSVIRDYGHLLRDDPAYAEKAARVSARARDILEFLDGAGLPPPVDPPGGLVAYQAACSMQHGLGVRDAPRRLLTAAGFTVREPGEAHLCCGSAGTYNISQPELAGRLRDRKLAALKATGASLGASGNIGCIVQLGGEAGLPVAHVVELLDWALGGPIPPAVAARRGG